MSTRRDVLALAALTLAAAPFEARSQSSFPDGRPIRIIVPYGPGGTADLTSRMVADRIGTALKAPVVLEFMPGGNLIVGATAAAHAAPDGHTLFLGSGTSHVLNPLLRSSLSYDPLRDFVPVSGLNTSAYAVAVPASSPARTLRDFVDLARSKPGGLSYGSFGAGNLTHLAVEMLAREAGVTLTHVPYKGSNQAEIDLIAGRIDLMITTFTVMSHVDDGKARVLAITTRDRSPLLPEVPTIAESGFPDYRVSGWFGFYAPSKTPPAIVAKLNAAIAAALTDPLVKERYGALGMAVEATTPAAMLTRVQDEIKTYAPIIQALGLVGKL